MLAGSELKGTVNLVQTESDGAVRIGGSITSGQGGTFVFGTTTEQTGGLILLPGEELAYVIAVESDGQMRMREKPLSEVICFPMPHFDDPTKPASPAPGPQAAPPLLSSRPTATAVIYLDFDGETVTDPAWNGGNTIVAAPAELTNAEITESWSRVKEDFWAYNIDVTTNLQRYLNAPVGRRMRAIITPTSTAGPGSGGVAYVNSFSLAGQISFFSASIPCWVFNQGIVGSSETISHEIGHTLGLLHDGRPGQAYYPGHGSGAVSWGPIMGIGGFSNSLAQWSKGEYADANNQEDDLAIIGGAQNGFGFVADEAGNTRAAAAPLSLTTGVVNQIGIITQASDSDFYTFVVTNPSGVNLTANPADISPNLDILIELQNSSGNVLASSNPDLALAAGFSFGVSPGTYYVRICGTGRGAVLGDGYSSYGSIGHYSLGGTIAALGLPVITSAATVEGLTGDPLAYQIVASNASGSYGVAGSLPPGLSLDSGTGLISGTPSIAGVYPVTLSATNQVGTGTAPLVITIVAGSAYRNSAAIFISDSAPATPYPSTISVTGFSGVAATVTVKLYDFNHTFPADVDILLVGPGGQKVLLMSDVGGGTAASGINLTFADAAATFVGASLTSGAFKPSNISSGDSFPPPAPSQPYGDTLATVSQLDPNGVWKLYVVDDLGADVGTIAGGWGLNFTAGTAVPVLAVNPPDRNLAAGAASDSFAVTANGNWGWSSSASWLMSSESASQLGSQLFGYTVAANTGPGSRAATITLTSGTLSATHTVIQAAGSPGDGANMLVQNLPNGSQSVWRPYGSNALVDASLATPVAIHDDAFDTVGRLEVETRSAFGTVTATNLWGNHGMAPRNGTFAATFLTTPSSNSVDTVIGFSGTTADFWDDLAACVRFNPQGKIDARDGGSYAAVSDFSYAAGVSYLVEMEINVVTKRYRVTVRAPEGAPVVIAHNYAFRTEQNSVTQLANFAWLTWTGGTQTVGGLVVPSLGTVIATNVWGNHPVTPRRKSLVATFSTTPAGSAVDTSIGFSSAAADFWDDLAAYVRFNPQGTIDARDGGGFAAASVLNYTAGVSYLVAMEIDIESKRYWATVTPAGGSPVLIANNYAFRTEQSAVTELSNFAYLTVTGGTQMLGGLVVSDLGTLTVNNVWGNLGLAPHDGVFLSSFITTPSSGAVDTSLGFSSAAADFWDDLAAYVRFNDQGKVDARNGGGFAAESVLTYSAGVSYLVEMEVNVPLKRYSVTVTPAGGTPVLIANNYAFRTEQSTVTSLANFAYLTWTGGFQTVRGFVISGTKSNVPALSSPDTNGPLAAGSTAEETRVSKEIRLVAGLHATDEVVTVENLSNLPRQIMVRLTDNCGSDGSTVVHGSSSGDQIVGPGDHWFISNDRADPSATSGDPTLMISWIYSANLPAPGLIQVPGQGNDQLQLYFVATLAGGEQAAITFRRQLFDSAAEAIASGQPLGTGSADLSSLTLSTGGLTQPFSPLVTAYLAIGSNASLSLTVTPTVAQAGATVKVNGIAVSSGTASGAIPLAPGGNLITIVVTAPDGITTKTYQVNVVLPLSDLENWRNSFFGTMANAGNAANGFDFDHDGLSNLLEYAFGLNPTLGSSCQTPKGQVSAGNFVISFEVRPGQADIINYAAEWSATMAPADWHVISDTATSSGYHTFSVPLSTAPKLFVRLKATINQ